jgi:hypothetical protein
MAAIGRKMPGIPCTSVLFLDFSGPAGLESAPVAIDKAGYLPWKSTQRNVTPMCCRNACFIGINNYQN